jgi:hypothetical protein
MLDLPQLCSRQQALPNKIPNPQDQEAWDEAQEKFGRQQQQQVHCKSRLQCSHCFTPAPTPAPPSDDGGSTTISGACTASIEADTYELGDGFDYKGKYEGAFCAGSNKPSKNVSFYLFVPHSCSYTSSEIASTTSQSFPIGNHAQMAVNPTGVTTISLPKYVMALLNNPPAHSIKTFSQAQQPRTSLLVADTGATNHMIPDKSAFISYHPCSGQRVCMGNNSFMPILGTGSAIISLNGKKILIRDCLHVQALRNPLYSLGAHQQHQNGCGFLGLYGMGMYVFFPSFILEADTAVNCHLSYEPLGRSATLSSLDYVQHMSTISASTTKAPPSAPAWIKPDNNDSVTPTFANNWLKKPLTAFPPVFDLSMIPPCLLSQATRHGPGRAQPRLYLAESSKPSITNEDNNATDCDAPPSRAHSLLKCMTQDKIITELHHPCVGRVEWNECMNSSKTRVEWNECMNSSKTQVD